MKPRTESPRAFIVRFALRLVPAYVSVSLVFFFLGPLYSKAFLPFISHPIRLIYPDYRVASAHIDEEKGRLECRIRIPGDLVDEQGVLRRAEIRLKTQILPSALYIYPILLLSLQLAWPGLRKRDRLAAILAGLPFLFLIEMIDIPLTLINQMENRLLVEGSMGQKLRLFLIHFFNNGGRQFAALIVGLVTIRMLRLKDVPVVQQDTHRNAPCPCGSGKKFKRCCM